MNNKILMEVNIDKESVIARIANIEEYLRKAQNEVKEIRNLYNVTIIPTTEEKPL